MVKCDCGVDNPNNAKYCQECGDRLYVKVPRRVIKEKRNLEVIKEEISDDDNIASQDQGTKTVKHEIESPWGVALLNLGFAGWGMLYLKQYSKAVLCLIIVICAGYIGALLGVWVLTVPLAYLLIISWTYDETKKYSQEDIK